MPSSKSLALKKIAMPLLGGIGIAAAAAALTLGFMPGTAADATRAANSGTTSSGANVAKGTGDEVWGASYFPNIKLTDQDGRQLRFFDDMIKGKVVSINFIFTSCSASCGLETARLKEVQQILGDRVGKDVFFYSISIDPLNDNPAELKKYAAKFGADIPGWRFLTGKEADIELIRRKLGMNDDLEDKGKNLTDHVLHTMLGNQSTGRWMKGSPYENPAFTANQLGSWLHNYKTAAPVETRYENAPAPTAAMGPGEQLYRHRCQSCHSIDGNRVAARMRIGPDLENVSKRRDATWIRRWIKEPDVMLAQKDPIAMAMYAQYNKIAMPNLKLDPKDIEHVLRFIEEESSRPLNERRVAVQ